MRRRDVVAALGVAVASSLAAKGQSTEKVWRLGWLEEGVSNVGGSRKAFFTALQELGYTEGQNLAVEYRFANTNFERLPELAAELVGLKLDVIVALSTQALLALQQATSTVPIVMVLPGDPLGVGLIKTRAHPGANITGTSLMMPDIGGKRLQLLKEIVPTMRRVMIIGNSKNKSAAVDMRATEAAAKLMGVEVHMVDADSAEHLENGLDEAADGQD
jgi:putative tryptophan/tyrosine transport system substrate-binding protein